MCKRCNGFGRISNPSYPPAAIRLDRQYDNGYISYSDYEQELYRLFPSGTVPDDIIPCPSCSKERVQ